MKTLIFLLLSLFLVSCANIKQMSQPQKKELLAYTQRFEKENLLVVASYLNPIYPRNNENDEFVVSIYPQNSKILADTITLNKDNEQINVEILYKDDEILQKIAFKIPWSICYKISAKAKNSRVLTLNFFVESENSQLHPVSLNFQKIAKSLYWNLK